MIGFLLNLFRAKKKRTNNVTYPFRPLLVAMKAKDAELYEIVGPMPIAPGIRRWREKYPEDFC